jgi:NAD(P)-dependent dehydrogenase (short-subunit alcohol dehydrogenase family)
VPAGDSRIIFVLELWGALGPHSCLAIELMNKVVLITGSSTGFGRATAELLGRRGYTVFASMRDCAGRNAKHRENLKSLVFKENISIQVVEMDVTDDASVSRGTKEVLDRASCYAQATRRFADPC